MLEPDHPHIWKKYGLQHFLSHVFPLHLLSMLGTQGMMLPPVPHPIALRHVQAHLPWSLVGPSPNVKTEQEMVQITRPSLRVSHRSTNLCESGYIKGQRRMHQLVSKRKPAKPHQKGSELETWCHLVNWTYDFPPDGSWGKCTLRLTGWEWMACILLFSHSTSDLSERFVLLPRAENDGSASLLEERML